MNRKQLNSNQKKKQYKANYGDKMTDPIKQLKHYNMRLTTVLNELAVLEDYEGADYSEFVTDFGFLTVQLEQRRERLQRRGRTQ